MSTSRLLRSPVLVPLAIGVLSLPLADAAYRVAGARPSDDLAGLYRPFGDGAYRLRDDVETSADWYSGHFSVLTDDLGLRSGRAAGTRTRPGDHVGVVVLGDSQGFGQAVDYEDSVVGVVAGLALEERGPDGRVVNASVGGHFLRNQLEVGHHLREADDITFETVFVLLTPYLIMTADQYNRATVQEDGKLWGSEPSVASRLAFWAKTHTAIYGVLRNAYWNVVDAEPALTMISPYRTDRAEDQHARLRSVMEDIGTWAEASGARVAVAYLPLTLEFGFDGIAASAAEGGVEVDPDQPARLAREVCEELGFRFFDARPVLAARKASGEELSLRGDPHYNVATSRVVGERLWAYLRTGLSTRDSETGN